MPQNNKFKQLLMRTQTQIIKLMSNRNKFYSPESTFKRIKSLQFKATVLTVKLWPNFNINKTSKIKVSVTKKNSSHEIFCIDYIKLKTYRI